MKKQIEANTNMPGYKRKITGKYRVNKGEKGENSGNIKENKGKITGN